MPLTAKDVEKAHKTGMPKKLWESGMYLEAGKYWRLKYRFNRKERRISLGVYPMVSLKEARLARDDAKKLVASGEDPSHQRKRKKNDEYVRAENSFEMVAREWFDTNEAAWAPGHARTIISRLENNVFPWLGKRPVAEIEPPEVLAVLRRIEDRGAVETAHRVRGICGQVFRYAVATGRASSDPASPLKGALRAPQTKHLAAVTTPDDAGRLLRIIDSYHGTLPVRCALKLAPLVFVRPGELRQAKWEDIDLENAEWRFRASKNGPDHIVPLAEQAVAILTELRPKTGHGEYVFPSARTPRGDRPMSNNAVLAALRRMDIGKDEMCGHGFRAMARTILEEVLGFGYELIEHQLSHQVRDTHGRAYNRTTHLPQRKEMMQQWADYLDRLKAGDDTVIAIGRRA